MSAIRFVTCAMSKYNTFWCSYMSVPSALVGATAGSACGWYGARAEKAPAPITALFLVYGAAVGTGVGVAATWMAPYLIGPVGFGYACCRAYEERTKAAEL